VSTLNYATRASNIKNAPTKNIDPKIREIQELKKKNKILQFELSNANKHIEFLTSMTTEQLQTFGNSLITETFGDSSEKPLKIDTSSPIKSRGKANFNKSSLATKGGSMAQSIGTSIGPHQTTSKISTQTSNTLMPPPKKKIRSKSKDLLSTIEKRETIDEIAKRKQFEDKMQLITREIKDMGKIKDVNSNDNFKDAMTRVTDLLKVNQMLRDETNNKEEIIKKK